MAEVLMTDNLPVKEDDINRQLERILDSSKFKASPLQIAFLKFVVNQTLVGKADHIKGYTVATQVFDRGPGFDQSTDPVVSIQASRLRRALERYYLTAGKNDPIRINIPKGTYVPTFYQQTSGDEPSARIKTATDERRNPCRRLKQWPTILVPSLTSLSGTPEDDHLSIGLTTELTHALSCFREIQVLEILNQEQKSFFTEAKIDFVVDGNIRRDMTGVWITIRLLNAADGVQIWSGRYQATFAEAETISYQEALAAEVAVNLADENAVIAKYLAGNSAHKPPSDLTTYEAMLRFGESEMRPTPQSLTQAIQALVCAVNRNPQNGQIWAMLAGKYTDNCGLELLDFETPLKKAVAFAEKGVCLNPNSRRTRMVLGYARFMEDKLQEARHQAEIAYGLWPDSLFYLDGIGWLMALAGDWDRGLQWVGKAIEGNRYCRPWARQALCLNLIREGKYQKAYEEALNFTAPELFWDSLLKASLLGHLGRIEEGQACLQVLLALKPDFPQNGHNLIARYVKFSDIATRILQGLSDLGMNTEPRDKMSYPANGKDLIAHAFS